VNGRKIIHVDMDCFYAAVEVKYRPELRGKPIGIGGPPNSRSVLCTASYEARKFGVRSAMPSSQAVRLCPELILLPPNFPLYKKESQAVREILARFTSLIQPLSLDEAYLDVTASEAFSGSATLIAQEIRRRIQEELGLTASAGVAPNKFLAKVASDWNKPNGQFVIRPEEVEGFVRQLEVEKIFGVGKVTARRMHEHGLFNCGDLQKTPLMQLRHWFGHRRAAELKELAHGIDLRPVEPSRERKSLTVEETFAQDLRTLDECLARLPALFADWEARMKRIDEVERISGLVIKVKFHDFTATTHERAYRGWPQIDEYRELLRRAWARKALPVRLLGLGVRLETVPTGHDHEDQLSFSI
jgi:DNA polymerase-4